MRDRLGWLLASRLAHLQGACGMSVALEWRRSDLAVLDLAGQPLALDEGKALYGFDARKPTTQAKYVNYVAADLAKPPSWLPVPGSPQPS